MHLASCRLRSGPCRPLDLLACLLPYKSSCSVYFVSVNVQSIFVSVIVLLLDVFYLNQLDAFYLNQATSLTGCWLDVEATVLYCVGRGRLGDLASIFVRESPRRLALLRWMPLTRTR